MTEPSDAPRRPRMSRRRKLSALVALLAILLSGVLWLQRRELARGYADDFLRAAGVPARYTIADLGPRGQRLENVVLGDPARPDLVADWVETSTELGLSGARVTAVRAGRVRLRGRVVDGRISLGVLDRLLPAPSGKPFAFPDIRLDVADGRLRLDTPAGAVGVKLSGAGGLTGGFAGTIAAVAPRLAAGGCTIAAASAYGRVRIARGGAPAFSGPIRAAQGRCGSIAFTRADVGAEVALGAALDRWRGQATVALAQTTAPGVRGNDIDGLIGFAGDARATAGRLRANGGDFGAGPAGAASWGVDGAWRFAGGRGAFAGRVDAVGVDLGSAARRQFAGLRGTGAGTPVGLLVDRLSATLVRASTGLLVSSDVRAAIGPAGWAAQLTRAEVLVPDGGEARLTGGSGIALGPQGVRFDGTLTVGGGDWPAASVRIAQATPGGPLSGSATIAPYRAGDASLALTPVRFAVTPAGRTFFTTRATLSGPLGGGRVERLSLAIDGGWDGGGGLVVNPRCARAGFAALQLSGLALAPAAFDLCPTGRALVSVAGGRVAGGAEVANLRLAGRIGSSPLALAAARASFGLGDAALRVERLSARLGIGTPSRLDLATLTGRVANGVVAGQFAGGSGQIGAVPLVMSDGAGDWRLAGGVLDLNAGLTVADANTAAPRLNPLPVRELRLRLADGRVAATGQVRGPDGTVRVADVTLSHDLSRGTGEARLAVPGVAFGDTLRPEQLTPVTFGVVSNVTGIVRGDGVIRWTPQGVTSTGTFGTEKLDFAAAFGPVTGLKTQIRFTDLLALESAPGQVATVAVVNPGVAIEDGVFRFQTLSGARVRVEGARWPLAGGELILAPTLLDFSAPVERRMTFRIVGLDARRFLQTFEYDNLDASGIFDGELPIVFDADGGKLEQGRLTARAGGTLAYKGEISKENLGTWGNLAFGALRSLRFRALELTLDGPLAGNIVTRARFAGVAQGEGATSNFLIRRLARLPFVFNVRIEAPFRGLIGSVRSLYDPSVLIEQNLPTLLREQERIEGAIQPPESEKRP